MKSWKEKLIKTLEECEEKDEWRFLELPIKGVVALTDKAVLLEFDRYAFRKPSPDNHDNQIWFPMSMMRKGPLDEIMFDKKMAAQKGLNI